MINAQKIDLRVDTVAAWLPAAMAHPDRVLDHRQVYFDVRIKFVEAWLQRRAQSSTDRCC